MPRLTLLGRIVPRLRLRLPVLRFRCIAADSGHRQPAPGVDRRAAGARRPSRRSLPRHKLPTTEAVALAKPAVASNEPAARTEAPTETVKPAGRFTASARRNSTGPRPLQPRRHGSRSRRSSWRPACWASAWRSGICCNRRRPTPCSAASKRGPPATIPSRCGRPRTTFRRS